ncbi:MAG: aminotransferase class V-fold PLP-dependent enzyme [Deltaproteobacteria bacterium]|nr:aminotransferase class V-fold PLP-dependent enzyme [Deltaproteobacteria bacterium]
MEKNIFFDYASTTPCCAEALEVIQEFSVKKFGNPSSKHSFGNMANAAIKEARLFFADIFNTQPEQILFTGSGSEANNLALYGICLDYLSKHLKNTFNLPPRILVSSIEHPSVKQTAFSLSPYGIDIQCIPVNKNGQIKLEQFMDLITPQTLLVSIHQVNNIIGSLLPVEELAGIAKSKCPNLIFHTDSVQAFGKVQTPRTTSKVDLVSLSAHKIEGPKGLGALIVLNEKLLHSGLRPLIWGGGQEQGFRSGTQNPGLISAFKIASQKALSEQDQITRHTQTLQNYLLASLKNKKLLIESSDRIKKGRIRRSPTSHWIITRKSNITSNSHQFFNEKYTSRNRYLNKCNRKHSQSNV